MSFILETMAFVQLAFLPGALLLRVFGLRFGSLGSPVACLAFSGLANYLFVLLTVACGVYNHWVALGLFVFELLLGIWLWRDSRRALLAADCLDTASAMSDKAWRSVAEFLASAKSSKAFSSFALLAALVSLFIAFLGFLDSTGSIFDAWDAVLSWNRWANDWLAGSYPEWTNGYPQLVPVNWSLCYMIQGDSLQFVPKMTVGLYELGVLLAIVDIAFLFRSAGVMVAAPLFAWLLSNVEIGRFGGDVDLAVTFMAFACFHCLLNASKASGADDFKRLLVATSALAAATAATKQSGLFIFVMIIPMAYLLLRQRMKDFDFGGSRQLRALALHLVLAALIAAPCYICAKYMVLQGRDKYKVKFVTEDIYGGRGYGERAIISSKMFLLRLELGMHEIPGARWTHVQMDRGLAGYIDFFKPYRVLSSIVAALTLLLLYLGIRSGPLGFCPLAFVALPLSVIWALMYCYDLRNLTSALPFLALGLGLGFERLLGSVRWRVWMLLLGFLGLLVVFSLFIFDRESLIKNHETLEMRIGDSKLNAKIYEYHEKTPISSKIATDYEFVNYLPGLKGSLYYMEFSGQTQKELGLYFKALVDPSVGYMLVPNYTMRPVLDDIQSRIASGDMERIFHDYSYMLIKINRKPDHVPVTTDGSQEK